MNECASEQIDIHKAVQHLRKVDQVLGEVISDVSDYRIYRKRTAFESLVRIIVGQQLSTKAARTIFNRLKESVNGNGFTPKSLQSLDKNVFASAGVSRNKTRTIQFLISEILSGRISLRRISRMSDEKIVDELSKIKGIGRWTAQMYLMFVLRRPDVFPDSDTGIINAIKELYDHDLDLVSITHITEAWKPFRTVACWFLWRYIDNKRT